MLSRLRQRHWQSVTSAEYQTAYAQFDGSFITHPKVLIAISELTGIKTKYFAQYQQNKLIGAIATWGKYIAGDKNAIRKYKLKHYIDLGNPQLILPLDSMQQFKIYFKADYISHVHAPQISTLKPNSKNKLCLLKSYHGKGLSAKYKSALRKKWRIFLEAGGSHDAIENLNPQQVKSIYGNLHEKRWGKLPQAYNNYLEILKYLSDKLYGYVLFMQEKPIAIQINYRTETQQYICIEYINGGIDPQFNQYSPGTILHYINTLEADNNARTKNKILHYSFGVDDAAYKNRWCQQMPLYRI